MLELVCPNCERIFFRSEDLVRTVITCPACHVRIAFDKTGKCKTIKTKYALEDPKHVRTYFNELKQHKVPFRTRMQWLSRIYGGRGGYTSEELYKIVTGKTVSGYYIFPFVKGAPPEVNRILERTYRTHREAGDTKTAAAIAAWTKVKQAGYVKEMKPAPVWVKKRRYTMTQLEPMVTTDYGVAALGKRGIRRTWRTARKHPLITRGAGAFGVGYLTHRQLAQRRKRKKGYQLGPEHITPDLPLATWPPKKPFLRRQVAKGKVAGKLLGRTAIASAKGALMLLALKEISDLLQKRRHHAPWMPEVRSDIELGGYKIFGQVVQYASAMTNPMLRTIKAKTGAVLHKTKVGTERNLLVWLLGFLTSELLGRGISKPQRRHEVVFPKEKKGYARFHVSGTGERLTRWGYQPFTPTKTIKEPLPKFKRPIGRRLRRVAPAITLPLAALLAVRMTRKKEGYSFKSAAKKTLRIAGKTGGGLSKGLGWASQAAIPALIISELWPRKKKRPVHPPVQSYPPWAQPYALGHRRRLSRLLNRRDISILKSHVDLSRTRMKTALKLKHGRPWKWDIETKRWRYALVGEVEQYPFKSKAQRRWMHWKKPKMAKEWEEHTPEGKELPEHVSKHALQVPLLWHHLRSARRMHKSRFLGRDLVLWGREMAARMHKLAASTLGQKITVKGVSTPAPAWFGKEAAKWDAVANQTRDMVLRGQLEKAGLLVAAAAAGVAGHEVGKKRERERVRKLVG